MASKLKYGCGILKITEICKHILVANAYVTFNYFVL